jgi:hypothetical protein
VLYRADRNSNRGRGGNKPHLKRVITPAEQKEEKKFVGGESLRGANLKARVDFLHPLSCRPHTDAATAPTEHDRSRHHRTTKEVEGSRHRRVII